jgi:hypothetical protein
VAAGVARRSCACLRMSAMCSRPALSRCSTNSCIGGCTLRYGFLLCPVNNPPPGPVDSPPPGPVDSPPPGPVDSPPPGPVDIPPPGPVESPPPGPVDSPPPGPVDIPPPGPVEAPPPGPVDSPPHRRVDNPPPLPVDRSRGQPLAFMPVMPVMLGDSTGHYAATTQPRRSHDAATTQPRPPMQAAHAAQNGCGCAACDSGATSCGWLRDSRGLMVVTFCHIRWWEG